MNRMTIGTLALASGVRVTTIRYYERAGLMPAPARTAGRHRNYTNDHQRRLLFICRARELEFSIEEIRMLLVLAEPTRTSCRDVQNLATAHLKRLRHRITSLVKLEAMLANAVARCSEANPRCPILELLDAAD